MTDSAPKLAEVSVVVPVFNSEGTLEDLTHRLAKVLPLCAIRYELILVNDCSRDGSWAKVSALAAQYAWVHGISFMRNFGQHNATLCGIRRARYSIVVTMDDDLQHQPEDVPQLVQALLERDADVVYGIPDSLVHSAPRNWASRITKLAMRIAMGVAIATDISTFRAFRACIREAFVDFDSPSVSVDVLLSWGASRYQSVKVQHLPRTIGESNYNLSKLLRHALNMVTGFSGLPLRLAGMVGFVFTVFGFLILLYILGNFLVRGSAVPGFAFIGSLISIMSGAQLFSLGIIGEYLARMHTRSLRRPVYVVRNETATVSNDMPT